MEILQNMSLTVIILSIIIGICIYVIVNMYYKIKTLEKIIENATINESTVISLLRNSVQKIIEAYSIIVKADRRGSFASDDEVGMTFKIIKNTIEELSIKFQSIFNEKK